MLEIVHNIPKHWNFNVSFSGCTPIDFWQVLEFERNPSPPPKCKALNFLPGIQGAGRNRAGEGGGLLHFPHNFSAWKGLSGSPVSQPQCLHTKKNFKKLRRILTLTLARRNATPHCTESCRIAFAKCWTKAGRGSICNFLLLQCLQQTRHSLQFCVK